MKPDHRDALLFALEKGIAEPGAKGGWLFINASPVSGLSQDWQSALICEQQSRPEFLRLESAGYEVSKCLNVGDRDGKGIIYLLGRNRQLNQHRLATLWNQMPVGQRLIIAGNKTDGAGSIRKWFSGLVNVDDSLSKFHAMVFWADKSDVVELDVPEIAKETSGYHLAEGMFSADGPDKGSNVLLEHFDNRIRGKIADLGAGWGFLSAELVKRSDRIDHIDLFEAYFASLAAAERNLKNRGICTKGFHWCDVTTEFPKKPYDWVIMNPPFHSGRAAEPGLGQRFIEVAASTLPRGGRLLMVANRNLPYERGLEKLFRKSEKLDERDGFKVIEAVR